MNDDPRAADGAPAAQGAPAAIGAASVAPQPLAVPRDFAAALVFLRHGQSEWLAEGRFQGRSETPLSPLGRRQAALAGARLAAPDAPPRLPIPAGEPVAIVHSPLARTRETLHEVDARVRAVLTRVLAELVAVAGARAAEAGPGPGGTPSYYDAHAGPWTLLVGHDGAFKVALLALLGLPLDRFWTFTQTTTGIAVLDIRNGRTVLRAWNRTEHLAPLELEAADATRADEDAAAERARSGAL